MPRCTVCKEPLDAKPENLYKGQFRCADHRGTLDEIKEKQSLIWENMGVLGELVLHPVLGTPELAKPNKDVIRGQIADEWIKKEEAKLKRLDERPVFTIETDREQQREIIRLRYGSGGGK